MRYIDLNHLFFILVYYHYNIALCTTLQLSTVHIRPDFAPRVCRIFIALQHSLRSWTLGSREGSLVIDALGVFAARWWLVEDSLTLNRTCAYVRYCVESKLHHEKQETLTFVWDSTSKLATTTALSSKSTCKSYKQPSENEKSVSLLQQSFTLANNNSPYHWNRQELHRVVKNWSNDEQ